MTSTLNPTTARAVEQSKLASHFTNVGTLANRLLNHRNEIRSLIGILSGQGFPEQQDSPKTAAPKPMAGMLGELNETMERCENLISDIENLTEQLGGLVGR